MENTDAVSLQQDDSKIVSCLKFIDVLNYTPIPQKFGISTTKSRIGSIIILLLIIAYFVVDLYFYITNSIPKINMQQFSVINSGSVPIPKLGIGLTYGGDNFNRNHTFFSLKQIDQYLVFNMSASLANYQNFHRSDSNISIPIVTCNQVGWKTQNAMNMLCPNITGFTQSELNQYGLGLTSNGFLSQKVTVNDGIITFGSITITVSDKMCGNVTCFQYYKNNTLIEISQLTIVIDQPTGFNYATGQPGNFPLLQNTRLFVNSIPNAKEERLAVQFTVAVTQFTIYPNYLTLWNKQYYSYAQLSNNYQDTYANPNQTFRVIYSIKPQAIIELYEIYHQTIIQRFSASCGLLLFVVAICVICYLGCAQRDYEKNHKGLNQQMVLEMKESKNKTSSNVVNLSERVPIYFTKEL